jgi:hypothetical protein
MCCWAITIDLSSIHRKVKVNSPFPEGMPAARKGGIMGMFISILKKPLNTPLAEGIPWGKSLLVRGCEKIDFQRNGA